MARNQILLKKKTAFHINTGGHFLIKVHRVRLTLVCIREAWRFQGGWQFDPPWHPNLGIWACGLNMLQDVYPSIKPVPGVHSYSLTNTKKKNFRQFNSVILHLEWLLADTLGWGSERCSRFNEVLDQNHLTWRPDLVRHCVPLCNKRLVTLCGS